MEGTVSSGARMVSFRSPTRYLAGLEPDTAAEVINQAADVALILEDGVIVDVALGSEDLTRQGYDRAWRGQPWIDTVTVESRPKIEDLLGGGPQQRGRWRQVNHPSADGLDVPVRYTAVEMRGTDWLVALGRELRSMSLLQQRLVEAHQNLERDYSRLREAETRYRLLFDCVSQPLLIVDAEGRRVEEANRAAASVLGQSAATLAGRPIDELFSAKSQRGVARSLADAAASGSAEVANLRLESGHPCDLSVSAFRREDETRLIVRIASSSPESAGGESAARSEILSVLEELPDGFVLAGADLRILAVNRAFVDMTRFVNKGQLVGARLSDVLGRSATDLNVLISNLKAHGTVRNFTTVVRDRTGNEEEVDVAGAAADLEEARTFGFSVRSIARRLRTDPRIGERLPSSAEQLTDLVGRVPLREIVRESADLIEKLCIEAALDITNDNRASAAEMLGLSRQGLYSKLRRFGIDNVR